MKRYRRVRIHRRRGVSRINEVLDELVQELDRLDGDCGSGDSVSDSRPASASSPGPLAQGRFSFAQAEGTPAPVGALASA